MTEGFLATLAAFGLLTREEGGVWGWRRRLAVAPEVLGWLLGAIARDDGLPLIDPGNLEDLPELALFELHVPPEGEVAGWRRERLGAREVLVPRAE